MQTSAKPSNRQVKRHQDGKPQPAPGIGILIWAGLLALAGAFFLYREAVGFPFLFDDMVHLRWLDWHSLGSLWTTAEGLGYYRPLTMSVWKVEEIVFGGHGTVRLHAFNILLHAFNAVLAGYVTWKAFPKARRAWATLAVTLLFVSFPFSYQAVPSTSSLSKPLIATLTLLSVLLYWESRRRTSPWLLGSSLLVGVLAPFAYETGVMLPVAIAAVEFYGWRRAEFEGLSWYPILFCVLLWAGALPLILALEPETGASLQLPNLRSVWQNGIYFVEGLLFPLTPIVTPLVKWTGLDQYLVLTFVDIVGLLGLYAFYHWTKESLFFLYGLSWFVVGILPQWLMLDFAYVITSPRILYLGAVGSAMLWAGVPILLWTRMQHPKWLRLAAVIAMLGMLGFNSAYVRHKIELADEVAQPLWQAARAASNEGHRKTLLYLNVPAWVAPKEATYRVGTEGLTFIPEYVRVQDFVYVSTGIEPEIHSYVYPPVMQDWQAYIGYAGEELGGEALETEIRQADGVYLTTYSDGDLGFAYAGRLEPSGSVLQDQAKVAQFGDAILLVSHHVDLTEKGLRLELLWHCLQTPTADYTVFAHIYNAAGELVTQADGYPLRGLSRANRWQPNDAVHDVRVFNWPDGKPPEHFRIAIGWYDATNGVRVSAFDHHGQNLADEAVTVYTH